MNRLLAEVMNKSIYDVRPGEESRLLYWIREKVLLELDISEIEQKMKRFGESIEMINAVTEFFRASV